jgi:hypothetical protein
VPGHGPIRRALVGAGLVAALGVSASAVRPQIRQWCVTVMDDDQQPVTGLGSEDFSLKDGGARQPVVASEPAGGPWTVRVAVAGLTVDNSQAVGRAVARFVGTLATASPGSRVRVIVDRPVSDPAVAGLAAAAHAGAGDVTSAGSQAWDAVLAAAVQDLRAETRTQRRAVVAILPSFPADRATTNIPGLLLDTRTPLWSVEVTPPRVPGVPAARTMLDNVLDGGVLLGGGLRWRVDAAADLPAGAGGVAALLGTGQYVVTISLPVLFSGPVPIATRHDRGVVLAPLWSR